jgi:arylsulfatase A-like enzyme
VTKPHRILEGAAFGVALLLLLLVAETGVVMAFIPVAVLAEAAVELRLDCLALYLTAGLALGTPLAALLLAPAGELRWRRAALPHLVLAPVVLCAWLVGDRDLPGTLLVAGVACLASLLALMPRRVWLWPAWGVAVVGVGVMVALLRPAGQPAVRASHEGSAGRPDLVLVVLDTLRRDQLSTWQDLDGGTVPTPALTALAESGARFDEAWAASPWSVPSHASLFSGRQPSRHGATSDKLWVDGSVPLLAEELARLGYRTVALSANPWVSPATGLTRGFQHAEGAGGSVLFESRLILYRILGEPLFGQGDKGARRIVERAEELLASDDPRPLFLFVNLTEAHAPYWRIPRSARREGGAADRAARRTSLRVLEAQHHAVALGDEHREVALRSYAAAVRYVDGMFGELVAVVDAATGHDQAIVLALADHGELFGEHGIWGHSRGLYRPLLQVPMVLRAPGRVAPGRRISSPVSLVDVAPTLLVGAGGDPAALGSDGVSLWPLLEGDAPEPERTLHAEHSSPGFHVRGLIAQGRVEEARAIDLERSAVIRPPWRYERDSRGGELLYHLASDPDELRDRSGDPEAADVLAALRAELDGRGSAEPAGGSEPPTLTPAVRERLRALGYVD